ncbi:MAG: MFS transporter [Dehalococcoidia bacterium]
MNIELETLNTPATPRRGLFYGWVIVGAAFWVDLLSYGLVTVAFGVFFPVMSAELGWGRGLLAGALLLHSAVVASLSPFSGQLVDRRGPRLLLGAGAVALGLGAAAMALVRAPWHLYAVYGGLMALGHVGFATMVSHATVAQWFVRRRGRALGFVTMGFSAAGFVIPLPLTVLIEGAGWRIAWVALGVATCTIGVVVAVVMRRRPEDMGLRPDGDEPVPGVAGTDGPAGTPAGVTTAEQGGVRAALRSSTFWLLLGGANAAALALQGINLHLVSYLRDRGLSLTMAATVVTVLYTVQTLAKPLWGFISDRLPVRACLAICYAGGAAGVLLLLVGRSLLTVLPFVVVYGLTRGAQSLLVSLAWAEYFDRGIQGRIRGVAAPFGAIIGQWSGARRRALRPYRRLHLGVPGVCRHVRPGQRPQLCRPPGAGGVGLGDRGQGLGLPWRALAGLNLPAPSCRPQRAALHRNTTRLSLVEEGARAPAFATRVAHASTLPMASSVDALGKAAIRFVPATLRSARIPVVSCRGRCAGPVRRHPGPSHNLI